MKAGNKSVPGMSDADVAMEDMQNDPNAGMDYGQGDMCIGTVVDVEPNKHGALVTFQVDQEHADQITMGQQMNISSTEVEEPDMEETNGQLDRGSY